MFSSHIKKVFIPAHILGVIALCMIPFVSWSWLLLTLLGWILFSGFGIAIGFHRLFSHRSFETYRWIEIALLILGVYGAEGSSLFWRSVHSSLHHPYADKEKDLHSPIHGKFSAFMGWMFNIKADSVNFRQARDLMRDPAHMFVHRHYEKILWIPVILTLILNWHIGLFFFGLPMLISIYQENFVNLFCHTNSIFTYRNFDTDDQSTNHWLLGYLTWGNAWHNNHHHKPNEYDFALQGTYKWWEFDPCVPLIWLIKKQ
jgi:fatty-acid desaturase